MLKTQKLIDKELELKPYRQHNDVKTVSWLNSDDIKKTFGLTYHVTISQHKTWLKNNPNNLIWTINYRGIHVGNISVEVNTRHNSANLQIYIGDNQYRGKKIGYQSMQLLLNYLFTNGNINRIELCTLTNNSIAISLYKKIGFILEGTQRQVIFKKNHYVDQHLWSILIEDWHDAKN